VPEFIDRIQKEWLVISGAPWSFASAVAASGVLIWLFMELLYRKEINNKNSTIESIKAQLDVETAGLKRENSVLEQQLKLAAKETAIADRATEVVEKQLQTLREEVAALTAKAESASLAKVETQLHEVEAAFGNLAAANNAVSSTVRAKLAAALMERWESDRRQP
jgi:hypothetical protein